LILLLFLVGLCLKRQFQLGGCVLRNRHATTLQTGLSPSVLRRPRPALNPYSIELIWGADFYKAGKRIVGKSSESTCLDLNSIQIVYLEGIAASNLLPCILNCDLLRVLLHFVHCFVLCLFLLVLQRKILLVEHELALEILRKDEPKTKRTLLEVVGKGTLLSVFP